MSDGQRMPLYDAAKLALTFLEHAGVSGDDDYMIVGSIRRKRETVGDIEIIAPRPQSASDPFLVRLQEMFIWDEGSMFPPPAPIGTRVLGGSSDFRLAKFRLDSGITMEIYRYDPGPTGNRGWIQMIRTGPPEFGQRMLAEWTKKRASMYGSSGYAASSGGYPLDHQGGQIAVPTEADAFRLVGMSYIEPEDRQ